MVNAGEELVEVCGFIQGMDDFGIDLAFRLHPVQICNIATKEKDAFQTGLSQLVGARKLDPAP